MNLQFNTFMTVWNFIFDPKLSVVRSTPVFNSVTTPRPASVSNIIKQSSSRLLTTGFCYSFNNTFARFGNSTVIQQFHSKTRHRFVNLGQKTFQRWIDFKHFEVISYKPLKTVCFDEAHYPEGLKHLKNFFTCHYKANYMLSLPLGLQ